MSRDGNLVGLGRVISGSNFFGFELIRVRVYFGSGSGSCPFGFGSIRVRANLGSGQFRFEFRSGSGLSIVYIIFLFYVKCNHFYVILNSNLGTNLAPSSRKNLNSVLWVYPWLEKFLNFKLRAEFVLANPFK